MKKKILNFNNFYLIEKKEELVAIKEEYKFSKLQVLISRHFKYEIRNQHIDKSIRGHLQILLFIKDLIKNIKAT